MISFSQIFLLASLSWGIIATLLLLIAWRSIRANNIPLHRLLMMLACLGGWSFVAFYLISYRLDYSYCAELPAHLIAWLTLHGVVALLTLLSVSILIWARLTQMLGSRHIRAYINAHHRTIGRITALLWLVTQAWGFLNLYIMPCG